MFRVLIYPKEAIDDLLSEGNMIKAMLIHSVFGLLTFLLIRFGPDKSGDIAWYFMEVLYSSIIVALLATLALALGMSVPMHILGQKMGGKGGYMDVFIAYSYGLVPMYTGILAGAMFPQIFSRIFFIYLVWSCFLCVKLVGYAHEISRLKAIRLFLIGHFVITVFIYLPTLYLIMAYNSYKQFLK